MTTTTRSAEDDSPRANPVAADAETLDNGQSLLGSTVSGDTCDVCGSRLAPDQRYCVECGTRRGQPRFTLQPGSGASAAQPGVEPAGGRSRRGGWTSSTTLLAGIATLLLALGVGVLIGESGSSTPKTGGIHVVVNGGGGSGSGAGDRCLDAIVVRQYRRLVDLLGFVSLVRLQDEGGQELKLELELRSRSRVEDFVHANVTPPRRPGVSKTVTKTPAVKPGGACTAGSPGCQNGKETGNFFP